MTVYVKSGGAWRAAANGRLWMKSGGAWRVASYCYIKSGGAWRDSGYRGYPLAPQDIWIGSNSFSSLDVGFTGPAAGGAPVDHYVVQELDGNGNLTNRQWNNGTGSVTGIAIAQNSYYQYRVKSVSAAGLESGWCGPIANRSRIFTGWTEQSHTAYQTLQRAWNASVGFGSGKRRDEVVQFYVANSVVITSRRFVLGLSWPGTYISVDPSQGNHQIYYVNWGAQADLMILNGVHDVDFTNYDNIRGADTYWGLVPRGIGWSPVGGNESQLLLGAFYMTGQEDYQSPYTIIDRAYRANALW